VAVANDPAISYTASAAPVPAPGAQEPTVTDSTTSPVAASESFEALLAPLLDKAYSVACHLSKDSTLAEDLVQEAALRAFRAFHQYQPGTNFKAWFMYILTNCFYEHCRKKKRQPVTTTLEDAEPLFLNFRTQFMALNTAPEDPATAVISRMSSDQIAEAIAELPEEFRVVCALYFIEESSYQEIAEMVGCPVGTVRSRLHRGRRMLQKALWHVAQAHGIVDELARPKGTE
jgi:RNA polymerase sigma-70 factor (ECF subfamily)